MRSGLDQPTHSGSEFCRTALQDILNGTDPRATWKPFYRAPTPEPIYYGPGLPIEYYHEPTVGLEDINPDTLEEDVGDFYSTTQAIDLQDGEASSSPPDNDDTFSDISRNFPRVTANTPQHPGAHIDGTFLS